MPALPAPYADLPARLLTLLARAGAAYDQWAADPARAGSAPEAHLKNWAAAYELRAAVQEQNPAFASTLAPALATVAGAGQGLPRRPRGVSWVVDQDKAGTLTLTVDVAGPLTVQVLPPGVDLLPIQVPVVQAPTRATVQVPAPADGLYQLTLRVGGVLLTTLLVPVQRALWRKFREYSRQLAYPYADTLPRPGADYRQLLALLGTAEAAARTGQPGLCARLLQAAANLPQPPTPTHLYPHRSAHA